MQIPMEILSQATPRADSGSGVRPRSGSGVPEGSHFSNMFDRAIEETQPQATNRRPNMPENEREQTPIRPNETDDEIDASQMAAGVMGNQCEVVIILEGDKESAMTPELCVETEVQVGSISEKPPEETTINPETQTPAETNAEPFTLRAAETSEAAPAAYTDETPEQTNHTETTVTTSAETESSKAIAKQAANAESMAVETQGEITARTPIIRTTEQHGNEEDDSGFSRNGDLSPLENENDTTPTKGQRENTFTDTVAAVRDAAETAQEPINTTVPLAEGIRAEQFRADQQMTQAVHSAPVRTENLFEEMVSRLETMQTDTERTMTIQLKPEFLGRVALELAMDAAGLHVKISAEDSGVRAMINGQINALIESLENKGIEVVEVEVAYTGVDNGAFKESREGQAQSNQSRRQRQEVEQADAVTYYTALPFDTLEYYLDAGVSSVEYSA